MAVEKEDGGPASPAYTGNKAHWEFGLSKREHYAGLAMQGLMEQLGDRIASDTDAARVNKAIKNTARLSFVIADAMIEAGKQ